jgi:general secretion pathway protein K
VDKIPIQSPKNEIDSYTIDSKIVDMQSRMNLNNMLTVEAQADFKRLLLLVDPSMNEEKAQEITLGVVDWITPGQQQNEYNKYYMSLSPPYRAAHKQMVSASELLLVKGMTPAVFNLLQPYVTALPSSTLVNVQTASAQVLAALSPTMTVDAGKALEKIRSQTMIGSIEAFSNLDLVKNHTISKEKITVLSNYFLVETTVTIEKLHIVLYTLIERTGNESKNSVSVIWQSKSVPG